MKRIEWAIAAILLSTAFVGSAWAVEQAGITAAVRGEVNLDPVTGQAAHAALSGEDVFLGDGISSGDASGLQLLLLDETIFTIGDNTELTIDDFVYDPATGAGQISASLTKGLLRFVTGSIAQGDADDIVINLPNGTLGIRGTTGLVGLLSPALAALILPDATFDPSGGDVTVVVLLETTNQLGMTVTLNGVSQDLIASGFGIGSQGDGLPSFPSRAANVGLLLDIVTPSVPPGGEPGAPLDDTNGGGTFAIGGLDGSIDGLPGPLDLGTPEAPDPSISTESAIAAAAASIDGISSFEQLRSIQTGTFQYNFSGVFTQTFQVESPVNKVGTFSAAFQIDFGAKTIGGSFISIDTTSDDGNIFISSAALFKSGSAGQNNYTGASGLAENVFVSSNFLSSNLTASNATINNLNDVIANTATINIVFISGSNQGNGSATSSPLRQ